MANIINFPKPTPQNVIYLDDYYLGNAAVLLPLDVQFRLIEDRIIERLADDYKQIDIVELLDHLKVVFRNVILIRPILVSIAVRKRKDLDNNYSILISFAIPRSGQAPLQTLMVEAALNTLDDNDRLVDLHIAPDETTPLRTLGTGCEKQILQNLMQYVANADEAGGRITAESILVARRSSTRKSIVLYFMSEVNHDE